MWPLPTSLESLASGLKSPDLDRYMAKRRARTATPAAVLALISDQGSGPEMLFIEKSAALRQHAGQMAFPGGRAEQGDCGPVDTAIREAWEETAVDPQSVTVLGLLPVAHVAVSMFDVTTVVAWWHNPGKIYPADLGEVAAVHLLKVADLVQPESRASVQYRAGTTGPSFHVRDLFIWGLTAHLVDAILDLAGWAEPWDECALVEVPDRFGQGFSANPAADEHHE